MSSFHYRDEKDAGSHFFRGIFNASIIMVILVGLFMGGLQIGMAKARSQIVKPIIVWEVLNECDCAELRDAAQIIVSQPGSIKGHKMLRAAVAQDRGPQSASRNPK